jgi:hypothetical protein
MRRLLQLAAGVLLLAGVIAPIVEFFDQWDSEGLEDDTEFGVFALIFLLCLALQVCKVISSAALQFSFRACGVLHRDEGGEHAEPAHSFLFVILPLYSRPLRI